MQEPSEIHEILEKFSTMEYLLCVDDLNLIMQTEIGMEIRIMWKALLKFYLHLDEEYFLGYQKINAKIDAQLFSEAEYISI